jgi:hypothetical protein
MYQTNKKENKVMVITNEQKMEFRLIALELANETGCCGDTETLISRAKKIYDYITKGE